MLDGADEVDSLLQQPFFLRLHQRNSSRNSPDRAPARICDHNPGLVPFLWETSPGLPKPYPSPASQDQAIPRLPPPPILQPGLISTPPRHSFSSKMKKMLRSRQRSLSHSFIDASAVCAQLESVESCDISDRKDVFLTMRQSMSTSSGLTVGLIEEDLLVAESPKAYHGNGEPDSLPRSSLDRNIFSPARRPTSLQVVSSFSSASLPRGLCSVSSSSLIRQHSDSTYSYETLSSHEQPSARGASEFVVKMSIQSDVECSKKSASHSNSCCALAENSSSALDQRFSRHESVFPEDDFTDPMKIRSSQIGSNALDENVASDVDFPLEFAATRESTRNVPSIKYEELHRRQDSKGRPWGPWNKRKKSYSLDAIFSSFDILQERNLTGVHVQGASPEVQQVKDKKSSTAKVSCLPKMCSTSQRCAVPPSKSIPKAGI